jgi:spermidine synthase
MTNRYYNALNHGSLNDARIHIKSEKIESFITKSLETYDFIVIDLPDPWSITYNQFYTLEFYGFCRKILAQGGVLVTQAGSPYYTPAAMVTINNTLRKSGFAVLPIHNQVLTLGEWGWIIAVHENGEIGVKDRISRVDFDGIETKWINREAVRLLVSFGKSPDFSDTAGLNSLTHPLVWNIYTETLREIQ